MKTKRGEAAPQAGGGAGRTWGRVQQGAGGVDPPPRRPAAGFRGWSPPRTAAGALASGRPRVRNSRQEQESASHPGIRGLDFKRYKSVKHSFFRSAGLPPNPSRIAGACGVRAGLCVAGRQTFAEVRPGQGDHAWASGSRGRRLGLGLRRGTPHSQVAPGCSCFVEVGSVRRTHKSCRTLGPTTVKHLEPQPFLFPALGKKVKSLQLFFDCPSPPLDPSLEGKELTLGARQVPETLNPSGSPLTPLSDPPPCALPTGTSRHSPQRSWRMAFCFSAFPLLFAFPTSGGAWGEKEAPLAVPPSPYSSLRASSSRGSQLGKERSPTPTRPPHPGLAVAGRRESCSCPASAAACGPGRISQIRSQARRKGQKSEKGAAFESKVPPQSTVSCGWFRRISISS